MRPDPLLQLRRVGLDPAEDGRVVDRDAAVLQHELEIAVADREHQIPAHGPEDHLGRKLPALERLTLHHRGSSARHAGAQYAASRPSPKFCNRAAGTNTRRVRRALGALFRGAVGKDVVSRTWRRINADWEGWNRRSLAGDDIVRLILDGTVVRVRLDRKATNISLLVVLGVRSDGQKVLLSVRAMGGESEAAWRGVLDELIARGLRTPDFLIIDGAAGLERALASLWPTVPTQRCTVHKHRNLLAHAPKRLHEEITADYTDMIYAESACEIETRRRAFLRKWRLKHRAVADSLEEAGDQLFTFTRLPASQWRSARTTNAIERLHEEFKRRIKTQTVLPSAETAAMLFWALLASGQITMRKVDGWQSLGEALAAQTPIDLAA